MKAGWKDQFTYRAVLAFIRLLNRIPERPALAAGRLCGEIAGRFNRRAGNAYADLKAAFGEDLSAKERRRIVRSHFGHIGESAVETLRIPQLSRADLERKVELIDFERYEKTVGSGRGVLFLTAHLGNWEILQSISALLLERPHLALARDQKNPLLNRLILDLRKIHGSRAMSSKSEGVREVLRALKRGELVGLLGDQSAGKHEGLIVSFFGRKTTIPTGPFELARRSGALILPCFTWRLGKGGHRLAFDEPLEIEAPGEPLERAVQAYVRGLEARIRSTPEQWLWAKKRWKYTWTKRLLILSDGKPGHEKQARALAERFLAVKTQYGREGMEYPMETLTVRFRSPAARRLFPLFALFFIPFAQGRLRWLKPFFEPETLSALEKAQGDFVISAGSSLTPLNLCLSQENAAKSIVMMRPSFPFHFFRYQMALIPSHDRGSLPRETFRTVLTPSERHPGRYDAAAALVRARMPAPEKVRVAVFLGGPTRGYRLDLAGIEKLLSVLERTAPETGDYMISTSRRTPGNICSMLRSRRGNAKSCQLTVIASEDAGPEVAPGMMALADIVVVTEDSISMISEAVTAARKVIVYCAGSGKLPDKHRRFHESLMREDAVVAAGPDEIEACLCAAVRRKPSDLAEREEQTLTRRLQEIL